MDTASPSTTAAGPKATAAATGRNCGTAATAAGSHATAAAATGGASGPYAGHLRRALARHNHRQHERHYCGSTQHFQIDHLWLHLRDIDPNPLEGWTFPSPRTDRALAQPVRRELYAA